MKQKERRGLKKKLKRQVCIETMDLDDSKCQSPYCDGNSCVLEVHSLDPPRHEHPDHLITLCRDCHTKCEQGGWMESIGDIYPEVEVLRNRISGREYEIAILEDIEMNRPDHFRWGEVLQEFYRRRKV